MHSSIFKAMARRALRGKWQKMALIVFVGSLISGGIQLNAGEIKPNFQLNIGMLDRNTLNILLIGVCVCLFLALMVGAVVNVGMYNLGGKVLNGEEPRMKMLFPRGLVFRAVFMNILRTIITFGAMIIAVVIAAVMRDIRVLSYGLSIAYVPAFFLSYCYAMADYLLLGEEKLGPLQALRESRLRMKGFKSDLFWLELSFIGWSLLSMLPQLILMSLLIDISQEAAIVAGFAASIVCSAFVSVYQIVAKTAFFRQVDNPDDGYAKKRQDQQEYARQVYENMQQNAAQGEDQPAAESEADPAPAFDEDAARELFLDYNCSRSAMHEAGVLTEYEAMGVDSSMELRWMRDYADQLIRRFDRDALTLEPILRFAAEYAHSELMDRALMRIDRHVRQETLPAEEILGMIGRCLVLVKSGVYDENPGYVDRKIEQISDIVDRLSPRIADTDSLQKLREMM